MKQADPAEPRYEAILSSMRPGRWLVWDNVGDTNNSHIAATFEGFAAEMCARLEAEELNERERTEISVSGEPTLARPLPADGLGRS